MAGPSDKHTEGHAPEAPTGPAAASSGAASPSVPAATGPSHTDQASGRSLRTRSSRTLAWLGDAYFELRVRTLLASLGDYPVERLDLVRARMTCAEAQAQLLEELGPLLLDAEREVVTRARNGGGRMTGRQLRDVKTYRAATGFEALVAWWVHSDNTARLASLLDTRLSALAKHELARAVRPRRG